MRLGLELGPELELGLGPRPVKGDRAGGRGEHKRRLPLAVAAVCQYQSGCGLAVGESAGAYPAPARRAARKWKRRGAAMAREKPEAAAEAEAAPERSYREQLDFLNPIAQPLASRKLTRKLLKCVRKGATAAGRGGAGAGPGHGGSPHAGLALSPSRRGSLAASKHKQLRRGVKEVQKFINKGEKG